MSTTATRTADARAFFAAIAADPDSDAPRLAFADFLQEWASEHPVRVPCPNPSCGCDAKKGFIRVNSGRRYQYGEPREKKCGRCDGSGTVLDTAASERGEFIRVQCEIERLKRPIKITKTRGGTLNEFADTTILRARERDLLARHGTEWRKAGKCPECEGKGEHFDGYDRWKDCKHCFGGDIGGLLRKFDYREFSAESDPSELVRVRFGRGLPDSVTVPRLADCLRVTQDNHGGYQEPSLWLAAVLRHHGTVRECVPLDREPVEIENDQGEPFNWMYGNPEPESPHFIPRPIWDLLELPIARVGGEDMDRAKCAKTKDAALRAFYTALMKFTRG